MKSRFGMLALVATLLVASGCASQGGVSADADASRQCFSSGRVSGFTPVDATTVHLKVGVRETYELKLLTYCQDIDWTQRIALRSMGGSSMICTNDAMGWEIILLDRGLSSAPRECRVRSIRKLEPEAPSEP